MTLLLPLDMLEDCLEGYAIFPGSFARRHLFDWFLLDVYPSIYNKNYSQYIYTIKGVSSLSNKYLTRILDNSEGHLNRIEESVKS